MDGVIGWYGGLIRGMAKVVLILPLVCVLFFVVAGHVRAQGWDIDPPLPNNDPQWEKVKSLYANHAGGKNLTELIAALTPLKNKYPDKVEPYLWLARVHYLHARYVRADRQAHFEKSENYAAQACRMDPKNPLAVRMLVETVGYSRDRAYIFNTYGALIRSFAPLPSMEALPPMKNYAEFDQFMQLWEARADLAKAIKAAAIMEKVAQAHPMDSLAQTWAARTVYYVGEYYTSTGEHDSKGMPYYKKGSSYAKQARALQPNSMTANYWYQANVGRSLQFASLPNQAYYFKDLLNPLLFSSRENSTYYFSGPIISLGTMIPNGGWVTEKGMQMAGIPLDMETNGLELSEILYPDYYYIPFLRADILSYQGKKKEALAILEKLLTRNPDVNKLIPENHTFLRMAKTLYNDIQKGKR